ncbi:hypothetical protein DM01DRAFT_1340498 [Hesseltinella vesiculosa]|uniref:Calcineurin-like phosphoesterase domain-containing protein n=1 Tax=Hesseltinella vesiculosa TaxID=101127 RepID=A0A1X2G3U2_9FUNG|nr:hypothetical protein DM01DRAFT_1340498 [Hesseltinella vesiculosa]
MDGGREWKDNEGWVLEKNRFFRLFPRQDRMVEQYTSGNHDIGISTGIQRSVYERFRRSFGPLSAIHPLAHNHSLVVLDTVALTSADELIRLEALQVLAQWHPQSAASLTPDSAAQQTMLVSHVPLYRPDQTSCGPLRTQSRPSIYQRYGYQYQNLLEAPLTTKLLEFVQPDLVFSGDDHDFCQVTHDYRGTGAKQRQATEYTVPTFSMAQGVRRPGYMLVQAMPDQLAPQLCWLPDQLRIYMVYGWAALATLLCLLGSRFWAGHDRTNRAVRLDRLKRDDDDADDVLPTANPASSSAQPIPKQPHMALFLSTARDLQQVAIVAVPFYIFCILCL